MRFPTQFDERKRVFSCSGSPMKKMLEPSFDDDGNFHLVHSGDANLYEEIQSHKDSVDINVLLRKYKEGDTLALERAQSMFGDFTSVPRSYSGMLNSMLQSKNIFEKLPVEVRARFDHSFEKFIAAMDDPSLFAKLVAQDNTTPAPSETNNKEDE